MMWNCPVCNEENGDYNAWCEFCYYDSITKIYNPTPFYIREIRYYHLSNGDKPMTPQEELFAKFFKKHTEIMLVKNMNQLEIQQYIESYSEVAAEAKAAVYAGDQLLKDKKKQSKREAGFAPETNKTQTDAINIIKQKKLSKKEIVDKQIRELYGLVETKTGQKVGTSGEGAAKAAEKAMSARNMLTVVENKAQNNSRFSFKKALTPAEEAIQAILNPSPAKMIVDGKVTEPSAATPGEVKSFKFRKDNK